MKGEMFEIDMDDKFRGEGRERAEGMGTEN